MQWMTVATTPVKSVEQFDALLAGQSAEPNGLQARYVGTTDAGELRIVTVWDSKAHADHFFTQTLGTAAPNSTAVAAGTASSRTAPSGRWRRVFQIRHFRPR